MRVALLLSDLEEEGPFTSIFLSFEDLEAVFGSWGAR